MLSRASIWVSQPGQRERGATIDSPRGTRWATTLAKLPSARPSSAKRRIPASIGAGAIVGPDVVLGAGAQVAAGARIRRSVVWAGARVEGEVNDAIVAVNGTVPSLDR